MFPYLLLLGVPAVISFLQQESAKLRKDGTYAIDAFFIIWLILLALRSTQVGSDLRRYLYHFQTYPSYSIKEMFRLVASGRLEAGYLALLKGISLLTSDFQWVIVACALLSLIPIWKMYREEDGSYSLLMIVLLVTVAPFPIFFSGLRQAIAMGICVYAYQAARKHNLWKFLLFVFCAFLFHRSALIFLLFYPVYHLKVNDKIELLLIVPIFLVFMRYNTQVFSFISRVFSESYYERYGMGIHATGAYAILLLMVLLVVFAFVIPDEEKLDDDAKGLRNILILCMLIQVFSRVHSLAMRMNYYFLIFVPFIIPKIMKNGQKRYDFVIRLSAAVMVLYFGVYFIRDAYTGSDLLNIFPYVPFWK